MTRIKCSNAKCPNKSRIFDWDESNDVKKGCKISDTYDPGAEVLAVPCPYCGTENKVWVVCRPRKRDHEDEGSGGGGGYEEEGGIKRNQHIVTIIK